jgi:hypothetical protein
MLQMACGRGSMRTTLYCASGVRAWSCQVSSLSRRRNRRGRAADAGAYSALPSGWDLATRLFKNGEVFRPHITLWPNLGGL